MPCPDGVLRKGGSLVELFSVLRREFVYINYYFLIQLRQIAPYWALGMVIGSGVSVFAKDAIHGCFVRLRNQKWGTWGVVLASVLGIASPLCMYGTIPVAASFSRQGMRHDWLAAFMMSSVLLNPQLLLYSMALGPVAVRFLSCTICGVVAGLLVHAFYPLTDSKMPPPGNMLPSGRGNTYGTKPGKASPFFDFTRFEPRKSRDTDPNLVMRFLKNLCRNLKATGVYFLLGVLLSALFQRYVPAEGFAELFGKENEGVGILMAATVGVPLYACGGGTIPLLQQWLASGMSMGSAAAFMVTGPATKITNLGALKIVLGVKNFILYIVFVMAFSFVTGMVVNIVV